MLIIDRATIELCLLDREQIIYRSRTNLYFHWVSALFCSEKENSFACASP